MSKVNIEWSLEDDERLIRLHSYYADDPKKWVFISQEVGKTPESCRMHWRLLRARDKRIEESPYPRYDTPLEMEGDALILPDPEFPFHHADFINRVLDLCQVWKITQCIIAGDMLHFDSLSDWSPNWQHTNGKGGLDEHQEKQFLDFVMSLGKRQQARALSLLDSIGIREEDGDPNVSQELSIARKAVRSLSACFDKVDCVIGNHEGRLLRQLHSPMFPAEITRLIDMQSWRVAPFYFSVLISNNQKFTIEHPKSAAVSTAEKLASKYQTHVICGHSHFLRFSWDISGRFYAITSGCCVDECRLPYAAQRHTNAPSHALGATVVRNGRPYLLYEGIDWARMSTMA